MPSVLGIKVATLDSVMTFQDLAALIDARAPDKVLITGEDRFLGYSLMCGARAALIGMGAACTTLQAELLASYREARFDRFVELNRAGRRPGPAHLQGPDGRLYPADALVSGAPGCHPRGRRARSLGPPARSRRVRRPSANASSESQPERIAEARPMSGSRPHLLPPAPDVPRELLRKVGEDHDRFARDGPPAPISSCYLRETYRPRHDRLVRRDSSAQSLGQGVGPALAQPRPARGGRGRRTGLRRCSRR